MISRSKRNRVLMVLILALAPLLMAPDEPPCDVCVGGTLSNGNWATHDFEVEKNRDYLAEMLPSSGTGTLTIIGDVVGLECWADDNDKLCSFTAAGDGIVGVKVTATSQSSSYGVSFNFAD